MTNHPPREEAVEYGDRTLKVEPFGIDRISERERHGRPWKLFPFWFGANVTLYSFFVGYLGITLLQIPVSVAVGGIVLGTLLGSAPFALLSILGPATGYPQIAQSRSAFGRRGAYVPAALNWVSTTGWSAVTFILGGLALSEFIPAIPFVAGVAIFAAIQVVVALYGHNFLHRFEQVMSVILVAVFAAMTVASVQTASSSGYVPSGGGIVGLTFMTILAASIPLSWAPYAADFSRYLPEGTARRRIFVPSFLGMAVACIWVEILGALLSTSGSHGDVVAVFSHSFGNGAVAPLSLLLAVNLLAANAPNLYSSGLSLLALDVPARRWSSVLVGGAIATVFAILGGEGGPGVYEAWLLFVAYWIAPWAAIVLVSFFVLAPKGTESPPDRARPWRSEAIVAYAAAVVAAVPFMDQLPAFIGPASSALAGLDLSDLVSFIVAAVLFYVLASREARVARAARTTTIQRDPERANP